MLTISSLWTNRLATLVLPVFLLACAGPSGELIGVDTQDPEVTSPAVEKFTVALSESDNKGEPVYTTSLAIAMAERALNGKGVAFKDRSLALSYCDEIYTITFERPEDEREGADYVVEIDARTSKILKVTTTR